MNRNSIVKTVIFYVVTTIALICSPVAFSAEAPLKASPTTPVVSTPAPIASPVVGQVVWVKGAISAISADKKTRPLERKGVIYAKDVIKTDKTSTGQLVFIDGSLLTIRSNSEIKISEYVYKEKASATESSSVIEIAKGGFRTITGAIAKENPTHYKVKTPVATIGVRGTDYSIVYDPGSTKLALEIIIGSIDVQNDGGSQVLSEGSPQTYAVVTSPLEQPTVVHVRPAVFDEPLPVLPAKVEPAVLSAPAGTPPTDGGASPPPSSSTPSAPSEPSTPAEPGVTSETTSSTSATTESTSQTQNTGATSTSTDKPGGICIQ